MWRQRSRIVAYLELILPTFELIRAIVFYVAMVIGIYSKTITGDSDEVKNFDEHDPNAEHFIRVLWFGVVFIGIVTSIDVLASVILLKATNPGADSNLALEGALNWRCINIILAIFPVLITGFAETIILITIKIVFRICFLFVVSKFIGQLRTENQLLDVDHSGSYT